jgi:hypothetical protein
VLADEHHLVAELQLPQPLVRAAGASSIPGPFSPA